MKVGNEHFLNMDANMAQCNYHTISQWLSKYSWTYWNLVFHFYCQLQFDCVWITHSSQQNETEQSSNLKTLHIQKKRKNENMEITTCRCTDGRCNGTGKTIAGSFEFLLTNPQYPSGKRAGTNWKSNRKPGCTKLGTTESCADVNQKLKVRGTGSNA